VRLALIRSWTWEGLSPGQVLYLMLSAWSETSGRIRTSRMVLDKGVYQLALVTYSLWYSLVVGGIPIDAMGVAVLPPT